jgi:hypothetical protein
MTLIELRDLINKRIEDHPVEAATLPVSYWAEFVDPVNYVYLADREWFIDTTPQP